MRGGYEPIFSLSLPFIPSVLSHKQLDSSRKFDVDFPFEYPLELWELFSLEPATGKCEKRRIAPSHNSLAISADGIFGRHRGWRLNPVIEHKGVP